MEKMDGSLGILYPVVERPSAGEVKVHYRVATRGSFHSEQAEWATEFFWKAQEELDFWPQPDKTYLFEIIYPENRIVVDYGEHKGLTLLDVIDNETGFSDTDEFDNCDWPDKVVRHPIPGFDSGQVVDIPKGGEGFVFLWPTRNFRTKMKSAEYVEIHRLVSNLSEKSVWEALVAGKTLDQIKVGLPEEFHQFIDDAHDEITHNAITLVGQTKAIFFKHHKEGMSRKDFALSIKDSAYKKYLFLMLDNKPVYPVALRDSKPTKITTREE
jgi:RNA ligase